MIMIMIIFYVHYRKRARGGSISGRLRTVSDMEDKGFIDKSLKGIIKDKIISGDKSLEAALDKFEKGNTTEIEGSGTFLNFAFLLSPCVMHLFPTIFVL